jgi:hypothetical protein
MFEITTGRDPQATRISSQRETIQHTACRVSVGKVSSCASFRRKHGHDQTQAGSNAQKDCMASRLHARVRSSLQAEQS